MSPQQQQRRNEPKTFLDASIVPLEKALLTRASILDSRADEAPENPRLGIGPDEARLLHEVASEFRALAEELHHW